MTVTRRPGRDISQAVLVSGFDSGGNALQAGVNQTVQVVDGVFQRQAIALGRKLVGSDREIGFGQSAVREVLRITFGSPFPHVVETFRHIRDHVDQHDDFVEMIEVVGGEQAGIADVGTRDTPTHFSDRLACVITSE